MGLAVSCLRLEECITVWLAMDKSLASLFTMLLFALVARHVTIQVNWFWIGFLADGFGLGQILLKPMLSRRIQELVSLWICMCR